MIEGLSQAARIERIASALDTAMRRAFGMRGMDASHGFSIRIGVALCCGAPLRAAELLARADARLHAAKRAGSDAWRMAPLVEADAPASAPASEH